MTASNHPPSRLRRGAALATAAALSLTAVGVAGAAGAEPPVLVVEDFETGLRSGTDPDGVPVGFTTFQGAGSTVTIDTAAPPATADGVDGQALRMEVDVTSYAGVVDAFANEAVNQWVPQDWSAYKGLTMWLHGLGTGNTLFVDVLENRNPGSTSDDAERWSVDVVDDFTGWREISIPFSELTRKGVGNNAPDDGFEGTEVHGWALGALGTGGARTYWVDNVGVYGVAEVPDLAVGLAARNVDVPEGTTGEVTVRLNRTMREEDPDQVTVDYAVEPGTAQAGRDYTPVAGTLTFTKDGPRELTFPLETADNGKDDGDRRVILRLSDPVGAAAGIMQAAGTILDDEPYAPLLLDDFERAPDLWDAGATVTLDNPEIAAGDADALPGQGAQERVLAATVGGPVGVDIAVEGQLCNAGNGVVTVSLLSTPGFDATSVDHTTVTLGDAHETHVDPTGQARRHEADTDGDGRTDLVLHFRAKETGLACDDQALPLAGETFDGRAITNQPTQERFGRDFALGQDWSATEEMSFWYRGQGTGDEISIEVLDNRAPDPGPQGWDLVWSDEFDEAAGTRPNPDNWGYELGDGTVNGIPGWGNSELQYYTDSPDNAATDGEGNLVITAREADGEQCYYGECEYTSARLLSKHKAEFAYGRIEARIQVPDGGAGLWPAFWSLGTDIEQVGWPQTGEIDFMEYVSRIPGEVFGTIHGPGYSGGEAYGDIETVEGGVPGAFRTTTVVWGPDRIEWYLDGTLYHTATPADVAPDEWVFNDPVFLLLNMAVGGSFGGAVDPTVDFPQEMKVDYVRVFQGPDTAERFEASFVDDSTGWRQVSLPFTDFERSADQPAGAPDDGFGLDEVWGYGFGVPSGSGTVLLDQVRLNDTTAPEVTITDDVAAETATGDVTFTFTFSEDVGTSFTTSDVVLTGGTKGAFTRVDATHATLVARPPADSTGTLEVAVAAGAVSDLAGNANAAGASARQAYDTPPAPSGGVVITFDEEPAPGLTGFGGAAGTVVADPTDAGNQVAQIVRSAPSELWAGVTVSTGPGLTVPAIPLDAATTMTARVWSPEAGVPVRLKVENATDGAVSVETEATTTTAGAWETLTFDLAEHVPGTPALDPAATYDKVSVFFDFGTAYSAEDAAATFYLDDLGYPVAPGLVISFDPAPTLLGFGGAEDSTVVTDPADPANAVLRVVKNPPEVWAGTIVATEDDLRVPVIPFTDTDTTITVRVWSPEAGVPVRLKVEGTDPAVNVETEATTTVAGAWETLTFDFANAVATPLDPAAEYNRVVIFFDFGTVGSGTAYYADDITFP